MNTRVPTLLTFALSGCSLIITSPHNTYGRPDSGPDGGSDAGPQCTDACSGTTPYCDVANDRCVECLVPEHCDDGDLCTGDRCDLTGSCTSTVDTWCIGDITAGASHTCVVRTNRAAFCWGLNNAGQLGNGMDGAGAVSATPQAVLDLTDPVEVSGGSAHTCARRATGEVVCWGFNDQGQLGDGTTAISSNRPVPVLGLVDGVQIAAGGGHTCARRMGGAVVCWGSNAYGQLGTGAAGLPSNMPVTVMGIDDAIDLDAGNSHTCALRASGTVVCWGRNMYGQLGNDSMTDSPLPVAVVDFADATDVTCGYDHSCAVRGAGTVVCWGRNTGGQLGDGTVVESPVPVIVAGLNGISAVAAGGGSCAQSVLGTVNCWGANQNGQLGNGESGTGIYSSTPVTVSGLDDSVRIAVGNSHACARRAGDTVVCWGFNAQGQLGDGTMDEHDTPVAVTGL